ncbi:hypothetical protein I3I95_11450 [bacterium]|nr:hypothetical protein [bacterium]
MGAGMTPEALKQMQERAAQRRAQADAAVETTEVAGSHGGGAPSVAADDARPEVDEEAVLRYIRSRKEVADAARAEARSAQARCEHLEHQLEISERKVQALRTALAQVREELKTAQAEVAARSSDGPAPTK